jgi:spermidine dehydrogenase
MDDMRDAQVDSRSIRLPSEISRRDFLNGLLLASGGAAVKGCFPIKAFAAEATGGTCDGAIGVDPRVLRGGNLRSVFNVAHWLRDGRLRFQRDSVVLNKGCDQLEGSFPISSNDSEYDVIVVGAGLSGLSAVFHLLLNRPDTRVLLLEASSYAGGNAGRDDAPPLPVPGSTAGAYCAAPTAPFLQQFYRELKVEWKEHGIADPTDCYYFDENTPGVKPGYRGWNIDTLGDGLEDTPYDERIVADLLKSRDAINELSIDDPPDRSAKGSEYLSEISFEDYLTNILHCDPIVSDFHSLYTIDALGATARYANAHSAISFLSGEFGDGLFTFPGGTSEVSRRIEHWLNTRPDGSVQIELNAVALRVGDDAAPLGGQSAGVTYFKDGAFRRAAAKTVIVATQAHIARRLVEHLLDNERKSAWGEFNTVPVVVANVALRSAAPLHELGLGYSQAWWGSRYWANFGVADWVTDRRENPNRSTVLTFFGGNRAPPEELAGERLKLLQTPFEDYENSLKDDLSRIMRRSKFEFDRDVSAIFLYRWGHSMFTPAPKWLFGNTRASDGRLDRTKAPRNIACSPLGPILFAGQSREGTPSVESALTSGYRTALEALAQL